MTIRPAPSCTHRRVHGMSRSRAKDVRCSSSTPRGEKRVLRRLLRVGLDGQGDGLAVAEHIDRRILADLELTNRDGELVETVDLAVTDLDDDVLLREAGPLGGTVGVHL